MTSKSIWSILSWRDWGLIRYNSIWQNVAAIFYISLARQVFTAMFIRDTLLFLLFSLVGTAYGYLVNDLADIELDRRAHKSNVFHGMSRKRATQMVVLTFGLVLAIGFPFFGQPGFVPLLVLWMLAATFYSLPPIRLKERGAIGLVATILAQQPLPVLLAFSALGYLDSWGVWIFTLYITLRGISSDVGHQMRDRQRDAAAGATTFAVRHGHAMMAHLYGLSLELEILALGGVLLVLLLDLAPLKMGGWSIAPAWPLLIGYLLLLPFTLGRALARLARGEWVDPYDESVAGPRRDLLHFVHHPFPSVVMPLYLAFWLTLYYWPNLIFIVGLILMYQLYQPARWAGSWPVQMLLTQFKSTLQTLHALRRFFSPKGY